MSAASMRRYTIGTYLGIYLEFDGKQNSCSKGLLGGFDILFSICWSKRHFLIIFQLFTIKETITHPQQYFLSNKSVIARSSITNILPGENSYILTQTNTLQSEWHTSRTQERGQNITEFPCCSHKQKLLVSVLQSPKPKILAQCKSIPRGSAFQGQNTSYLGNWNRIQTGIRTVLYYILKEILEF